MYYTEIAPTFFDDPDDGDKLNGVEGETGDKIGFQAGQVRSLAEMFSKTVWKYNEDSNTFTRDSRFTQENNNSIKSN